MKIRINREELLYIMLMISFFVPGVIGELISWIGILMLINCNSGHIIDTRINRYMFGIIIAYISLYIVKIYEGLDIGAAIRLLGITKCCAGVSICFLFSYNLVKKISSRLIINTVIATMLVYVITCDVQNGNTYIRYAFFKWILEIGSINMCSAILAVSLPVVLFVKGMANTSQKIVMVILAGVLYVVYPSGSLLGVLAITLLFSLLYVRRFGFRGYIGIRISNRVYVILVMITVAVLINKYRVIDRYVDSLQGMDIARYNMLMQAIQEYSDFSLHDKIFGIGNNSFYIGLNYTSAHNMILEVLRVYGILGLIIAISELVIILYLLSSIRHMDCSVGVICSTACVYMYYLIHPYYVTSLILKLFFVLINLKAISSELREKDITISEKALHVPMRGTI